MSTVKLPTLEAMDRAVARLGCQSLHELTLRSVINQYGEQMARVESLLHEVAHYRVAGGPLVETVYRHRNGVPTEFTRLCRISEATFDEAVNERMDYVSVFVSDAYELDAGACVQLAGKMIGLWKSAAANPAQVNLRNHQQRLDARAVRRELRLRRRSHFIQGCAEDVAEWWKRVFNERGSP